MWQITWMVGVLPGWIWTTVTVLGVVALLASWAFRAWRIQLKVGGIVAIVLGSWCMGIAANEKVWAEKVKQLEKDLEVARAESTANNTRIEEKTVYVDRVIKERGKEVIKYLDNVIVQKEEIKVFVENCPVPRDIIEQHNIAATLNQIVNNMAAETKK